MAQSYNRGDRALLQSSAICEKHFNARIGMFPICLLNSAQTFIKNIVKMSGISDKQIKRKKMIFVQPLVECYEKPAVPLMTWCGSAKIWHIIKLMAPPLLPVYLNRYKSNQMQQRACIVAEYRFCYVL